MIGVGLICGEVNQNVVNIDDHAVVQKVLENFVKKMLRIRRHISQVIWHNKILILPPRAERQFFTRFKSVKI